MTDPIQPATDEEVEAAREAWSAEPVSWVNTQMMRFIARIDAEKARAEALYASCEQLHNEKARDRGAALHHERDRSQDLRARTRAARKRVHARHVHRGGTMTTTHRFTDGIERPAHRHRNPDGSDGGWVADTATVGVGCYVSPTAQVTGNAQVMDNARVMDTAQVTGDAQVTGNAWVMDTAQVTGYARVTGNARVTGGAWDESPPQMQIGRWTATLSAPGVMAIGCQSHTFDEWEARADELMSKFGATPYEAALARVFLALCRDVDAGVRGWEKHSKDCIVPALSQEKEGGR